MRLLARNVAVYLLVMFAANACHHTDRSKAFVDALRCGMTRDQVSQLAAEKGYNPSDASWLTRSANARTTKELTLVDLTFRDGRLIAVRQGSYDPRTKAIVHRTINLCAR